MLSLRVTPHRPVYPVLTSPQQAYILLEALPGEDSASRPAQPVNFCLVLDRSGSMAGEKLRALKEAACQVVDRLGPADVLSVVIFDDADPAELVAPAALVTDRQALKRQIEQIEERGGTHMSTGMRLGLQQLERGRSAERVNQLLLLTDGQTWEDQDACRELADQCRQAGAPISVFGLGLGDQNNWDPQLLEDLARRSGGEWQVVESPEQVGAAFARSLQMAQSVSLVNVHLTLRLVQGVTPRTVWRVAPLISRLDHEAVSPSDVQVYLGDLRPGEGQAVLVDVLLPVRPAGSYRLAQADISGNSPSGASSAEDLTGQRAAVDVVIQYSADPAETAGFNQPMMNLIERVVAHRLQTQALDEAAAGNALHATQKLRAAATRLLELGEADLAHQASQQADQLEQTGRIDLAEAQKMRYATRRLTEMDT